MQTIEVVDEASVWRTLDGARPEAAREVLAKARELGGLSAEDVAALIANDDPEIREEMFATARRVKEEIYGTRLVLFAPLYISNLCRNECVYCAFRVHNQGVRRRALSQSEIASEVKVLVAQGHKRILLVSGEAYPHQEGFRYILDAVGTIYADGGIRRVNVNLAPLAVEQFRELKAAQIGTYQLFQETYHRETYARMHVSGPKRDYDWRVTAVHRAMEAGIDDVGIGPLLGLFDWRFEVLAMLEHIRSLERVFGCGPHTISVPRLEPADGSDFAANPDHAVSDADFLKLIAILRLAVPYTGMIMSTRENQVVRRETFKLGISQISAGSRTDPGGYGDPDCNTAQFQLGDHRTLDEVVRDISSLGYLPSFCTACYRMGRTGRDFMDLAKPGDIKQHCAPNALSTFQEYLGDYASPETCAIGDALIDIQVAKMEPVPKRLAEHMLRQVRDGRRDVYV
jgi:2-iminoacetate synthase